MTQHREVIVSERTERVRGLDVKIAKVRRESFLGRETILSSIVLYRVDIMREGKHVPIYWTWAEPGPPSNTWASMSCGTLIAHSATEIQRELRALPDEAIG